MGKRDFKFIVIGSGPAGEAAALAAAQAGLKTAIVGFKNKVGLRARVKELSAANITCIHGHARFMNSHEIEVGKKHFTSEKFLIATGRVPVVNEIAGIDEVEHFTPKEALKIKTTPKAVFVVGAGSRGCEIAQHFADLGVKVILAEAKKYILPEEDEEVSKFMEKYFSAKNKIKLLTKARVTGISKDKKSKKVAFVQDGREKSVRVDTIIFATGSKPATDLNLANAKIKNINENIVVNESLQTSAKNIWAAGSVINGEKSIERAVYDATVATSNIISGGKAIVNYGGFMRVTNTMPKIAKIGVNAAECKAAKVKIKTTLVPLSEIKYKDGEKVGFLKMITDKKGSVLGATAIMPDADLAIQELSPVIRFGLSAQEVASTPHAANTWSEVIRLAAKKLAKKK